VPYFVFAYVGMAAWGVISACLTKISASLVGNSQLISKIFFPRLVLPLSTLGSTLVDFAVTVAMGAVVLAVAGVAPGWAIVLAPVWILLAVLLGVGVGLVAAALMVPYRDVQYVLPVATQLLLYGTPIAYSLAAVPVRARWAVQLNPLSGVLEGFRWSVLGTSAPSGGALVWSVVAAVLVFLVGAFVFTRMERKFADVI
jgi:lipopolysaccharide transport system permease protein